MTAQDQLNEAKAEHYILVAEKNRLESKLVDINTSHAELIKASKEVDAKLSEIWTTMLRPSVSVGLAYEPKEIDRTISLCFNHVLATKDLSRNSLDDDCKDKWFQTLAKLLDHLKNHEKKMNEVLRYTQGSVS